MITIMLRIARKDRWTRRARARGERGTAMVIAMLVLMLLTVFVAASLSRVTNDAVISGNTFCHSLAFYAAQAGLEKMSRNFSQVFTSKTAITPTESAAIRADEPTLPNFDFDQEITKLNAGPPTVSAIPEGPFAGLISLRDSWKLDVTARGACGSDVKVTRTFYNHLVPIFQFAAFYESDMEFFPGGTMQIAGRVHTNGNLYVDGSDLHFGSAVTAANEIVVDVARNGTAPYYAPNVWVTDGSGGEKQVTDGSVNNGPDVTNSDSDVPNGSVNTGWESFRARFNENLVAHAPRLQLPLQVDGTDPVEIIKRGRATDTEVVASGRYYNKACIRVSLDDSQSRLPGGTGGRRLDGASDGLGADADANGSRGYHPRQLNDGYRAVRFNGHRFYTGPSYTGAGYWPATPNRQTWIKVEIVTPNYDDPANPTTVDITEDFLALGLTARTGNIPGSAGNEQFGDPRAILRMQRYTIDGPPLRVDDASVWAAGDGTVTPSQLNVGAGINQDVYTYDSTLDISCVAWHATAASSDAISTVERTITASFSDVVIAVMNDRSILSSEIGSERRYASDE